MSEPNTAVAGGTGNGSADVPALHLKNLVKHYATRRGTVRSVDGVDLTIRKGEILGLVGESGSGKSTLGKLAVALAEPTSGSVVIDGTDVSRLSGRELRRRRKSFNIVFQDPGSSLNPRMTVGEAVAEPLRIHRIVERRGEARKVAEILDTVGLRPEIADRYVHMLSGGQRQRVSLARALAPEPTLLVADEPTSALDVSVQASVLNLIADLQHDLGFACLFISHDLAAVEYLADRVAVMYLGRVVEVADAESLFTRPLHPYSEILLKAAPLPDPDAQRTRERIVLGGDLPSPLNPPAGCRFHPRCPIAVDRCRTEEPELREIVRPGGATSSFACHLVDDQGVRPPLIADMPSG
ncbi:ABC transporter ATP-binding protein [Microtetraspora niveoalba]|uniref:ABC transporter ATP-binding protein n=1 Tax=Microtetraspora niveoalba TaxID=46175 RepID=UPI000A928659|nr:oligopeptide/dipeptide ABC transporter ATP-binding protein [Microtetraspora niveoalba]